MQLLKVWSALQVGTLSHLSKFRTQKPLLTTSDICFYIKQTRCLFIFGSFVLFEKQQIRFWERSFKTLILKAYFCLAKFIVNNNPRLQKFTVYHIRTLRKMHNKHKPMCFCDCTSLDWHRAQSLNYNRTCTLLRRNFHTAFHFYSQWVFFCTVEHKSPNTYQCLYV